MATNTTQVVARSVRELMAGQGKSNKELAQLLGCTDNSASKKRLGKVAFSIIELYAVAHWLGVTTDSLAEHRATGVAA